MGIEILKETNSQSRTILNSNVNVFEQLKSYISKEPKDLLEKVRKVDLKAVDCSSLSEKLDKIINSGNKPIIICNCGISDGNNSISRFLLNNYFEKIIAGMNVIAKILDSEEGILYLPGNSLSEKITEKSKTYGGSFNIKLAAGEENLVIKNETALFEAIDRRYIKPYFCESDMKVYKGKPVLVIDAEMACDAFEALSGKTFGKLMLIRENTGEYRIAEVKIGTTLADLFDEIGIDASKIKAVLLGGILGKFITSGDLVRFSVEYSPLYSSIQIFDSSTCMVDETFKIVTGAYEQSCGKCVLCREGTTQFRMILGDITKGRGKLEDLDLIKETSEILKIGTFCEFGRTMIEPVLSSIELFQEEYKEHIKKKRCPASVCTSFLNYYISPNDCTGCEECLDACPEDAIEGKDGYIHMIDEDLCTKCGKCKAACPENAIMIMGAIKPRLPKKLTKVGRFK